MKWSLKSVRHFATRNYQGSPSASLLPILVLVVLIGFQEIAYSQTQMPRLSLAICASERDDAAAATLERMLRAKIGSVDVRRVTTIDDAAQDKSELLYLILPDFSVKSTSKETLASLKERRIIGFGLGAAKLFGAIGKDINSTRYDLFYREKVRVVLHPSRLLGDRPPSAPYTLAKDDARSDTKKGAATKDVADVVGMLVSYVTNDLEFMDPLARSESDPKFCYIVAQDRCVFVGLPIPFIAQFDDIQKTLGDLSVALRKL